MSLVGGESNCSDSCYQTKRRRMETSPQTPGTAVKESQAAPNYDGGIITRDSPSNHDNSPSATSLLADPRLSEESRTSVVAVASGNEEEDGYDHEESHPDIYQVADTVHEAMEILQASTMPVMVTLSDTYTVAQFEEMFPDKWRRCHRCLIDGRVILYELPAKTHERPAAEILLQLCSQSQYISSEGAGDICFDTIEHRVLQPDQEIFVWHEDLVRPGAMDARNSSKLPKLVVEVSFRQPFGDIFQRVSTYFSRGAGNGVRAVLVIIVRKAASSSRLQLLAVYFEYDNDHTAGGYPKPSVAVSFGDYMHARTKKAVEERGHIPETMMQGVGVHASTLSPACTAATRQEYQLRIPTASVLFHGYTEQQMAEVFNVTTENFPIDLYSLKCAIRDSTVWN